MGDDPLAYGTSVKKCSRRPSKQPCWAIVCAHQTSHQSYNSISCSVVLFPRVALFVCPPAWFFTSHLHPRRLIVSPHLRRPVDFPFPPIVDCVFAPPRTWQRGYWNNFRNETFNGLPFAGRGMEGRWFVNNPPKGKVRLDYVSTTRPFPGTRPLSDRRFRQARKSAISV